MLCIHYVKFVDKTWSLPTAARPICRQKHRRAMYQWAVTMFYTNHTFKGCFKAILTDIFLKF